MSGNDRGNFWVENRHPQHFPNSIDRHLSEDDDRAGVACLLDVATPQGSINGMRVEKKVRYNARYSNFHCITIFLFFTKFIPLLDTTSKLTMNYPIPKTLPEMVELLEQPVNEELVATAIAAVVGMARHRGQTLADLTAEVLKDDFILDRTQRDWLSTVVTEAWNSLPNG